MNQTIKQLKQAAGIDYNPDQEGLDLFAKLLVEECVQAIKNDDGFHLSVRDLSNEFKQGVQLGLDYAITDIKQHFGLDK